MMLDKKASNDTLRYPHSNSDNPPNMASMETWKMLQFHLNDIRLGDFHDCLVSQQSVETFLGEQ
jgi:hypothetical protein